jgi:hypothetical protein
MQRYLTADTPAMPAASASDPIRPPRSEIRVFGWLPEPVLSWGNALLTSWRLYPAAADRGIVSWGIVNAVWSGEDGAACRVQAAARVGYSSRPRSVSYLRSLSDAERWRVVGVRPGSRGLFPLMVPQIPGKAYSAIYTLFVFPVMLLAAGRRRGSSGAGAAAGLVLRLVGIACLLLSRSGSSSSPTMRLGAGLSLVVAFRW